MNLLRLFQFSVLARPWFLALWIAVALLLFAELAARPAGVMPISTGETLARLRRMRGIRLMWTPAALRAMGLALLVVALAGPLQGFQPRRDRANVRDIMLCVDVSGSMQQQDFIMGGYYRDRLFVTKHALREFIASRKDRRGDRYGLDRLGLICYARYAWTQCPLTLDYDVLQRELDRAEIVTDRRRDGTAIGSAIGLAVRRLSQSEAKSKVIVLLTDGLNNRGELDPITAARMSQEYGIRIYTIGVGATDNGVLPGIGHLPLLGQTIDEEGLKRIADITGGQYYHVTNTEALQMAYADIATLEATEIEIGDYYEFKEAHMPWLILGAVALVLSVIMRGIWFETIP